MSENSFIQSEKVDSRSPSIKLSDKADRIGKIHKELEEVGHIKAVEIGEDINDIIGDGDVRFLIACDYIAPLIKEKLSCRLKP